MRNPSDPIRFRKMEATGNDYVYFGPYLTSTGAFDRNRSESVLQWLTDSVIRRLSDRHFGVGGDGVVLVAPPLHENNAARMYMWNADGSPLAMCGNALRSVALLIHRETRRFHFSIETGDHSYECLVEETETDPLISVDMGPPILDLDTVPYAPVQSRMLEPANESELKPARIQLEADGQIWTGRTLSMGNPHFVVDLTENQVGSLDSLNLEALGPALEHHPAFPERVNIEFIERKDDRTIRQRTFERGSGETLSCGSGACAAFIASRANQGIKTTAPLKIELRGGTLILSLEGNRIKMQGPARIVFEGLI